MRRVSDDVPLTAEEAARLFHLPGRPAEKVLLAVSGGPDSIAMSGLYAEACKVAPLPPAAIATVDHCLREASALEAADVAKSAENLGFEHQILRWSGKKPETGIQEAARLARYRLLTAHARKIGASAIFVAHTLDDQAETVLMRLMRGSGIKGLGGMDSLSLIHGIKLFRPFLTIPKARLVATCKAQDWPYVVDPANTNPGFLRARLRALAPALAKEGLNAPRLGRFATRMRRADEALDALALRTMETARIWGRGATLYDAALLAAEADEIVIRIFTHVIAMGRNSAGSSSPPRLERIEALAMDFRRAVETGSPFRRNAGGVLFTLRNGVLSLRAEPERRTARLSSPKDKMNRTLGNAVRDA